MTNEQRIRGADAGFDWAVLVTGYEPGIRGEPCAGRPWQSRGLNSRRHRGRRCNVPNGVHADRARRLERLRQPERVFGTTVNPPSISPTRPLWISSRLPLRAGSPQKSAWQRQACPCRATSIRTRCGRRAGKRHRAQPKAGAPVENDGRKYCRHTAMHRNAEQRFDGVDLETDPGPHLCAAERFLDQFPHRVVLGHQRNSRILKLAQRDDAAPGKRIRGLDQEHLRLGAQSFVANARRRSGVQANAEVETARFHLGFDFVGRLLVDRYRNARILGGEAGEDRGIQGTFSAGMTPTSRCPTRSSSTLSMAAQASENLRSTMAACSRNAWPARVRRTRVPMRSNRLALRPDSSSLICCEMPDCATRSCFAARVKFCVSATAMKVLRWRSSIDTRGMLASGGAA